MTMIDTFHGKRPRRVMNPSYSHRRPSGDKWQLQATAPSKKESPTPSDNQEDFRNTLENEMVSAYFPGEVSFFPVHLYTWETVLTHFLLSKIVRGHR